MGIAAVRTGVWRIFKAGADSAARGASIGLVRADAGFFEKRLLEYLENQQLPYIIVARLTAVVPKLVIHQIPSTGWRVVAPEMYVADLEVSLPNWKAVKRRFVCLRQEIAERPEATREAINRLSGIYVSGDGAQRTVCRRSG